MLGVLTDDAVGNYPGETIYDDMDLEQIEGLADTQLHRDVDLEIVKADKEGKIFKDWPKILYNGVHQLLRIH